MIKKYFLYLVRWQLSTPILAVVIYYLSANCGATVSTIIANMIGGLMFFWFDRWLFSRYKMDGEWWEVGEDKICHDCGKHIKVGYRLIMAVAYNRTEDKEPQFRCSTCRDKKYEANGKECPLK